MDCTSNAMHRIIYLDPIIRRPAIEYTMQCNIQLTTIHLTKFKIKTFSFSDY